MKCLVSGATGFVGRALCAKLNAGGVPFVGLSRRGATLPSGRVTTAVDLATRSVDSHLIADVDVVFHLAGIAHQKATPTDYQQVNYRATMALAAAAATAGVKLFVFISSVKAMGPSAGTDIRTEDNCTAPQDAYAESKRRAELDLQAAYAESDMSVVILRPALIYGSGAAGNLQLMARAVRAGLPRPPPMGGRSMIALGDLVELLFGFLVQPPSGIHTWIVCDGHFRSAREIHDLMRGALHKAPASAWMPAWAWRLACGLQDTITKAQWGSTFDKIFSTELYSAAAVQQARDWHPGLTLESCIEEMMGTGSQQEARAR